MLPFDFQYPLTEKIPEDKICSKTSNPLKGICILAITAPSEHFWKSVVHVCTQCIIGSICSHSSVSTYSFQYSGALGSEAAGWEPLGGRRK